MNGTSSLLWLVLFGVAAAAVILDLFVHRRGGAISRRRAIVESSAWIVLALLFDLWILHERGRQASAEFLAGYLVEKSLSLDNLFLFLVIFRSLRIPDRAQHRVLYYGVAGALLLRAGFVFGGVALLGRFAGITLLFGAILLFTAFRMLLPRAKVEQQAPWIIRWVQRLFPVAPDAPAGHFFVRRDGLWLATPLLLALLAIEVMDVVFAVDSVPAVLAITRDPFIAYSSNVFAVLGLRALYFVLASLLGRVRFLHQGLAAVLIFTGGKMIAGDRLEISSGVSLAVIVGIFAVTTAASLVWPLKEQGQEYRSGS